MPQGQTRIHRIPQCPTFAYFQRKNVHPPVCLWPLIMKGGGPALCCGTTNNSVHPVFCSFWYGAQIIHKESLQTNGRPPQSTQKSKP